MRIDRQFTINDDATPETILASLTATFAAIRAEAVERNALLDWSSVNFDTDEMFIDDASMLVVSGLVVESYQVVTVTVRAYQPSVQ